MVVMRPVTRRRILARFKPFTIMGFTFTRFVVVGLIIGTTIFLS